MPKVSREVELLHSVFSKFIDFNLDHFLGSLWTHSLSFLWLVKVSPHLNYSSANSRKDFFA